MEVSKLLSKHSLFSHLSAAAIYRLMELAQIKKFLPGELILKEGEAGLGCFIIIKGNVEVIRSLGAPQERRLAKLGEGEIIGEISVIDEQPHSASVRAVEDTECIMIERWDFRAQMQAYPQIALQLLPILAKRLRDMMVQQEDCYAV
jgi:CRP/FNR family transcriptional regulator, cyclic AMP receptor protein